MESEIWRMPVGPAHRLAAAAGPLTFVGGAGDFAADGVIRNPGDQAAQLGGTVANIAAVLATEGCELADAVRLKVFYRQDGTTDPWPQLAALLKQFPDDPGPAVTMLPVAMQPFAGQELQVQVIAQRGWRAHRDVRVVQRPVPAQHRDLFRGGTRTVGLRAGELVVVPGRTASESSGCGLDGIEQTSAVMAELGSILGELGASFSDAVKKEGYYNGTDLDQWAEMAAVRARHFSEPGPVATVVPWHAGVPDDARTQIEILAMREEWNGYDKYIPRADSWPKRVWDWPIPVPYRQGIALRDMIWLGGQVPWASGANTGAPVLAGQLLPQTQFVMSYVDDILHGFGATTNDLSWLVCYFASDGSPAVTSRFVQTLSECVSGPLPPLTLVPQPYLHNPETMVEIWGVARG